MYTKKGFSSISFFDGVNIFSPDYEKCCETKISILGTFHSANTPEVSKQGKMIRKFPWKVPENQNHIFRNANDSTKNSWMKINWNRNFRYIFCRRFGHKLARMSIFYGIVEFFEIWLNGKPMRLGHININGKRKCQRERFVWINK